MSIKDSSLTNPDRLRSLYRVPKQPTREADEAILSLQPESSLASLAPLPSAENPSYNPYGGGGSGGSGDGGGLPKNKIPPIGGVGGEDFPEVPTF